VRLEQHSRQDRLTRRRKERVNHPLSWSPLTHYS
jgi:hypothetical protein